VPIFGPPCRCVRNLWAFMFFVPRSQSGSVVPHFLSSYCTFELKVFIVIPFFIRNNDVMRIKYYPFWRKMFTCWVDHKKSSFVTWLHHVREYICIMHAWISKLVCSSFSRRVSTFGDRAFPVAPVRVWSELIINVYNWTYIQGGPIKSKSLLTNR